MSEPDIAPPPGRPYSPADARWQVPSFTVQEFFGRRSRALVCVPVIDEGIRIQRQLARMRALTATYDVIVADGRSSDGSVAEHVVRPCGVRGVLTKTGPGRLSAQMRMALAWGLDEGYEGFVFIDGNDKDDPAAIPQFAAAVQEGWDHVQGSRYIAGGKAINTPALRHWGVRLLHAPLISAASGFRYTDTTNGFRAYSARFLRDDRVRPFRDVFSSYELHYYLAIRAARLGFRVKEIPVTRAYPVGERTPTKISGVRGNLRILGTLLRSVLIGFAPPRT